MAGLARAARLVSGRWAATLRRPVVDSGRESRTVRYENSPDGQFEAALRLAEDDPIRGGEALRAIVADDVFADTRFEAAARLAQEGVFADDGQADDSGGRFAIPVDPAPSELVVMSRIMPPIVHRRVFGSHTQRCRLLTRSENPPVRCRR